MAKDDLKLKAEQLIDEAYKFGYIDGTKNTIKEFKYEMLNSKQYQHGLNDAWECARKMYQFNPTNNRQLCEELYDMRFNEFICNTTPQEAIQKIKDYERKQKWAEQSKRGKEHRDEIEKILEKNTKRTCDNCSHPKYGCQECGEDLDNWKPKQVKPKYENCKKCRHFSGDVECNMQGCGGWYYYEKQTKDDYVDAIVKVRVPKWQIGEKVNLYFKDTMSMDGICERQDK